MKNQSLRFLFPLCVLSASSALATVPSALEPDYADAVLALHDGKPAEALQHLHDVLKRDPNQLESLQLSALSLKTMGRVADAKATYEQILRIQQAARAPESAEAPFHFELGVLAFQAKDYGAADMRFSTALRHQFNLPVTHFFLGLISFQQKDWSSAEAHFRGAAHSNIAGLRPSAFLYLGQLAKRRGDTGRAIAYLSEAEKLASAEQTATASDAGRTLASDNGREPMAQQVIELAGQELAPYRVGQWFGQVGLSSGYDSNVLSSPDGVTGASGNSSWRETLLWGLGYATGPADGVQFVPSYHGSFNYNTNPDTKIGEFLTHTATLFINPHATAANTWGMKTEAQMIWGYTSSEASLSPYSLAGSVGPYYRRHLSGPWSIQAELYAHPQDYFTDNLYPSSQARTGWGATPRLVLQRQTSRGYWNPQLALVGDYTHTNGEEYRAKTGSLEAVDTMYLDKQWTMEVSGSVGVAAYDQRPGQARTDKLVTLRATATRQLNRTLSLSGDLAYLGDSSNVATYAYTRFVGSLALNCLF